jgi:hypothetical protein
MREGPFTDDMVRHLVETAKTQEAISKYGRAMAEFLAEAAVASENARGDPADYALVKWMHVITEYARELIREKRRRPADPNTKAISAPDVIDG